MTTPKTKICFIMHHVTKGTHMDYVYEMARTLREDKGLDIHLILEKGSTDRLPSWVTAQSFNFTPFRIIENICLVLKERLRGTKMFYVHYSFLSAITAGLITKVFGGKVFYWNAGMPWQYNRPWYIEWYQKAAYRLIDTLVTGAEALREGYQKHYTLKAHNIEVIPNWIDLASVQSVNDRVSLRRECGFPVGAPMLLFVHKLAKRKGAHLLIPIFSHVTTKDSFLVIAGDGPEMGNVRAEAERVGLMHRIHFLGKVSRVEVSHLFQAADIFLMPSEEEGSPHSLIEALAYGVPPVAFSVGGVLETLPPQISKYAYVYGDVTSFAQGIDFLLHNPSERENIKALSTQWVQRFDKQNIVEAFYTLLTRSET